MLDNNKEVKGQARRVITRLRPEHEDDVKLISEHLKDKNISNILRFCLTAIANQIREQRAGQ